LFWSRLKKDSVAALPPAQATRPTKPFRPAADRPSSSQGLDLMIMALICDFAL